MNTAFKEVQNNDIFFSIIMPCYNSAKYVDRAIQSCINQTFKNWELIIVNDGSTDNTLDILNSYASQDKRIKIFSKNNGGYVSAMNYGLGFINGIYFTPLGSDDELRPDLFSEIFNNIKSTCLPDFIGFRALINKNDAITNDKNSYFEEFAEASNTDIKSFSHEYPEQSKIFFTRDTSKLYKSELLGSLRYLGKKGMDADGIFSMMYAHKASSFLCVPVDGYIWHLRDDSLSGRKKDYATQIDRINTWIEFSEYILALEPSKITGSEKNYLINYFFKVFRYLFYNNYFRCIKDGIVSKTKKYLINNINVLNYTITNPDLKFFLKHTFLWSILFIPKYIFEKLKEKL